MCPIIKDPKKLEYIFDILVDKVNCCVVHDSCIYQDIFDFGFPSRYASVRFFTFRVAC